MPSSCPLKGKVNARRATERACVRYTFPRSAYLILIYNNAYCSFQSFFPSPHRLRAVLSKTYATPFCSTSCCMFTLSHTSLCRYMSSQCSFSRNPPSPSALLHALSTTFRPLFDYLSQCNYIGIVDYFTTILSIFVHCNCSVCTIL